MAEVQRGTLAVRWGLSLTATGTGIGTFTTQSAGFTVDGEVAMLKGPLGSTKSEIHFDTKESLTLEVVPTGTTRQLAKDANVLPAPGAIVTVSDTEGALGGDLEIAAGTAGNGVGSEYIFVSGSKQESNTDWVKLTFNLRRYTDGTNVAVALS